MTAVVDFIDDRFAGIDIDSLLNGERRPLSYERKKALYEAPEFIQRLSGEETVMEGQSLCIECKIRGFPVPSVRWFKDDEEIIDDHRIQIQSNGIGGYFLVIENVNKDDEAAYRCRAENIEGACSSFFFLSVKGKPKNPKSRDPSGFPGWRTVSYPPMFSTIVEKVEEEEIQGRELEQLPTSPMTEFYYALTLKSRCVWPTFLGDWAFVNGHPHKSQKDSDGDDDEDEGYNDVDGDEVDDDEEEDDLYNNFFIPNGYICDKLKPQVSNKAHLAAKRSLKRGDAATRAKSKKQRFNQNVSKEIDKEEDAKKLDKQVQIICQNEVGNDVNGYNIERNAGYEKVILDKTKMEEKFERTKIQKRDTENSKELESKEAKKRVAMKGMDVEKMANESENQEEGWTAADEVIQDQMNCQKYIWTAVERTSELLEQKRRLKEEKMRQEEKMRNEENLRKKQEEKERSLNEEPSDIKQVVELYKDGKKNFVAEEERHEREEIQEQKEVNRKDSVREKTTKKEERQTRKVEKDNHPINETKVSAEDISKTLDESVLWKPGKTFEKYLTSRIDSKQETAPLPEIIRIFKSNSNENILHNGQHHLLQPFETLKEKTPITQNKINTENTNQYERVSGIRHVKSDNQIYTRRSANETNDSYSYSNLQKSSIDVRSRSSLIKPLQAKGIRTMNSSSSRDRLEELRQQEIKRIEELEQEELKRMEELRLEGTTTAIGPHRRKLFQRGDVLLREKQQIEELRRKEQFQREELRQKEQKQLEELRMREGQQIETSTIKNNEQRDESLNKQREYLRLKERFQKEELQLREIQHKVQLHAKELLHKEELKEHEQRQIDDLKDKERRQLQEIRRHQNVYGDLEKEEEEDELRKRKKMEELLLQYKKEQLRKVQLRRQFEEETEKRQKKEEESKRLTEQALHLSKKEKDLRGYVYDHDYLRQSSGTVKASDSKIADGHNFTDSFLGKSGFPENISRTTLYSVPSSNREKEPRYIEHQYYLQAHHKEPLHESRALFTKSLDRPRRRASENYKSQKDEDFLLRSSSVIDNCQSVANTGYPKHEYGRWHIPSENKEKEITTRVAKSNTSLAYCEAGSNSRSLTPVQSPTSWSFASLFGMDESNNSKPAFRTHEELCKLARSIAEKREQFHEDLSKNSVTDNVSSVSDTAHKSSSYMFGREASKINDIPINKQENTSSAGAEKTKDNHKALHKQAIDLTSEPQKSKDTGNLDVLPSLQVQAVLSSVQNDKCTPTLVNNSSRDTSTLDSFSIASRPFLRNSSRTVARRFYKTA